MRSAVCSGRPPVYNGFRTPGNIPQWSLPRRPPSIGPRSAGADSASETWLVEAAALARRFLRHGAAAAEAATPAAGLGAGGRHRRGLGSRAVLRRRAGRVSLHARRGSRLPSGADGRRDTALQGNRHSAASVASGPNSGTRRPGERLARVFARAGSRRPRHGFGDCRISQQARRDPHARSLGEDGLQRA